MSQAAYQRVASASHGILAILVFIQHPKIKSLIYVTKTKLNKEDNKVGACGASQIPYLSFWV